MNTNDYKANNARLDRALKFAVDKHAGQLRKGSNRPYILHPIEVLNLLSSMGADFNLMIAGVLHDTVEDTDTTPQEIEDNFGAEVAALVASHTEDKNKNWQQRKDQALAELSGADERITMLIMADKLSNLRSMSRDYKVLGEELWSKFNAPKEKQYWYYSKIVELLKPQAENPRTKDFYFELESLYKSLFKDVIEK